MKNTLTFTLLLLAITSHSQVSINAGLSSRMQGTFKAAIEKQSAWNNTELSTSVSTDNYKPVIGLQTGYSTCFDFQTQTNIRLMAGAFFHSSFMDDKNVRCKKVLFGGSIRGEFNDALFGLEYNGETINLTIGFIFKTHK